MDTVIEGKLETILNCAVRNTTEKTTRDGLSAQPGSDTKPRA
jgi:hypothetical protein